MNIMQGKNNRIPINQAEKQTLRGLQDSFHKIPGGFEQNAKKFKKEVKNFLIMLSANFMVMY